MNKAKRPARCGAHVGNCSAWDAGETSSLRVRPCLKKTKWGFRYGSREGRLVRGSIYSRSRILLTVVGKRKRSITLYAVRETWSVRLEVAAATLYGI